MFEELTLERAMEIVLELARQNTIDQLDNPSLHEHQSKACDMVEYWFDSLK